MGQNPLFIPDTLAGPTYNLTVAPAKVQFLPGDSTDTYGINGPYLGPTLIVNKGDNVQMNVTNMLPDTTTMHWHGMHVAPQDDGGPWTVINPGETWSPDFEVLDEATTFWYHPHLHHKTAQQVYAGAAGMMIVRDAHEASLNLPRTYGVDDFPLILQDKSFDANNQFIFEELSDTMMINGTMNPYLEVPRQMVRFRVLNASNQRAYNIGFPMNIQVAMIGSDGGLLEEPFPINRLLLAPGERAEIVINFDIPTPGNFFMLAANSEMPDGVSGAPNGPGGGPGNPLDGNDFDLIEFRLTPPTPNAVTSLPTSLTTHSIPDANNADVYREKVFDTIPPAGFPFYINGNLFDFGVVNDTVMLGDTEVWTIVNRTSVAHPFHIHDVQFFVTQLNGFPPPPPLRGRKDVIMTVPGDSISFVAIFEDHADPTTPYMYHCHNLFHEDGGMMGQFIVVDPSTSAEEGLASTGLAAAFTLFPNPAQDQITLQRDEPGERLERIVLRDVVGKEIRRIEDPQGVKVEINTSGLTPGIYFVEMLGEDGGKGAIRFIRE